MKQLQLPLAPAYTPRQYVRERLEGFLQRQRARDARRARKTARKRTQRVSAAVAAPVLLLALRGLWVIAGLLRRLV